MESLVWKYRRGFIDTLTADSLAEALANSSSYAETHRIIAQFEASEEIGRLNLKSTNYILNKARINSQISNILLDADVKDFIIKIAERHSGSLDKKNEMLFQDLKEGTLSRN